jgi:DNA-directed RNA polymerase subunit beta
LVVPQQIDETGIPEEFSRDLFPLVELAETSHLDTSGLPKIGTRILPGMIIVGRIARTKEFDPSTKISSLEIHGSTFEEVRRKYGAMWVDRSLYADAATSDIVNDAKLARKDDGLSMAIVELDPL